MRTSASIPSPYALVLDMQETKARLQRQAANLRKAEEEGQAALARSEAARSEQQRRLESAASQVGECLDVFLRVRQWRLEADAQSRRLKLAALQCGLIKMDFQEVPVLACVCIACMHICTSMLGTVCVTFLDLD